MGSKLIKFSVESFPAARAIGRIARVPVEVGVNDRTIQDLWESLERNGSLAQLLSAPDRFTPAPDTVGWMGDFQPGAEVYTYLAGVLFKPNASIPEGFEARDVASGDMAHGWIQSTDDNDGGDMMANASGHLSKAAQAHGYEYDGSHGFFEMEYYSYERFRGPFERGEKPILDFYSPCRKVAEKAN